MPVPPQPRSLLWWIVTAGWAGLIFYLSTRTFGASFSGWLLGRILSVLHLPVSPATFDLLNGLLRKSAHLAEYAIFGIFIYHSLAGEKQPRWSFRRALASIVIAGLYSLSDEFHQSFVPNRSASLGDSGMDTVGATLGTVVIYLSQWIFAPRTPSATTGESK